MAFSLVWLLLVGMSACATVLARSPDRPISPLGPEFERFATTTAGHKVTTG
jgi:hypothetical protein